MIKKILFSALLVAVGVGIYCIMRSKSIEPEDLAAETKPIVT